MEIILFFAYMFEFLLAFMAGSVVYVVYCGVADAIIRFKMRKQTRVQKLQ